MLHACRMIIDGCNPFDDVIFYHSTHLSLMTTQPDTPSLKPRHPSRSLSLSHTTQPEENTHKTLSTGPRHTNCTPQAHLQACRACLGNSRDLRAYEFAVACECFRPPPTAWSSNATSVLRPGSGHGGGLLGQGSDAAEGGVLDAEHAVQHILHRAVRGARSAGHACMTCRAK